MTDDELIGSFKHLSQATAATVREAFRMRAEWKKKNAVGGVEPPTASLRGDVDTARQGGAGNPPPARELKK